MATGIQRGVNQSGSLHRNQCDLVGGLVGAGAAAALTLEVVGTLPVGDNFAASCTRTSVGLFVITMKEFPSIVLDIDVRTFNSAGTTIGAKIRSWSVTAKTATIEVRDSAASGALADPTTGEHFRIVIKGRASTS